MTEVIIVDQNGQQIGLLEKGQAQLGKGRLHRAVSVLLFNSKKELLIQQRSSQKMLWPLFWSNTCCSHPHPKESYRAAAQRRLKEEFGIRASLKLHHQFIYQARYGAIGSEHEFCSVFIGFSDSQPKANQKEIVAWKYVDINQLKKDIKNQPQIYTPWFHLELKRIRPSDIVKS